MNLNRQQWYVRWFFWSLGVWDTFLDRDGALYMERHGTNLCFFLRTMFVWAPLILVLHAIVYGAAIAALTIVPIYLFGGSGYFWSIGAIVTLFLIIFGEKALRNHLRDRSYQRRQAADGAEAISTESVPAAPSFFRVLWEWFVAQKKKICPMITFPKQEVRS